MPTKKDMLDLEVKDAQVIFKTVWEELEEEVGHDNLRFPKELILLGGAPGAGKGTHTNYIMKVRGLTCPPIVVSQLLVTPKAEAIKAKGGMVGDKEVIGILYNKLLEEQFRDGALLDGFPRTRVQVECLKMLVDRTNRLHQEHKHTPLATQFRRPTIHAMVLFIGERTSIERQAKRGLDVAKHNLDVQDTGIGDIVEQRGTDLTEETTRRRYQVFKEQTWDALTSLKEIYHYHFVNAEGPIEEVEDNIRQELEYQSSLELEERTFDRLRPLPLAAEIIRHARQELVKRLDSYEIEHTELFNATVNLIRDQFMPVIKSHAISGRAIVNTEEPHWNNPLALGMLIDIFSERGFHAVVNERTQAIPIRVDLTTGEVTTLAKKVFTFQIHFKGSEIRRG
jgi:adenylate kinase